VLVLVAESMVPTQTVVCEAESASNRDRRQENGERRDRQFDECDGDRARDVSSLEANHVPYH
jgi:hypothetical protein